MSRIKQYILTHEALRKPYYALGDVYHCALSLANPVKMSRKYYRDVFGRELDLNDPKTLNEKIMYLKLKKYWNNPVPGLLADKYRVREYVERCGLGGTLTKLYGVWDDAREIDWDSLPQKFVLKCNHGSGYNIVCTDKAAFDTAAATKQLNRWLRERYGVSTVEQGIYDKIERRIIAEEFIETEDGHPPRDYKIFCSYGEAKFLYMSFDRYEDRTKFDYYEPSWEHLPVSIRKHSSGGEKPKPANLDEIIRCAEQLSKPFPIVRVDLYSEMADGKPHIYFGEMTFSSFGALIGYDPDEYDYIFGARFPDAKALEQFELTEETIAGTMNKAE